MSWGAFVVRGVPYKFGAITLSLDPGVAWPVGPGTPFTHPMTVVNHVISIGPWHSDSWVNSGIKWLPILGDLGSGSRVSYRFSYGSQPRRSIDRHACP